MNFYQKFVVAWNFSEATNFLWCWITRQINYEKRRVSTILRNRFAQWTGATNLDLMNTDCSTWKAFRFLTVEPARREKAFSQSFERSNVRTKAFESVRKRSKAFESVRKRSKAFECSKAASNVFSRAKTCQQSEKFVELLSRPVFFILTSQLAVKQGRADPVLSCIVCLLVELDS
jgi:hypothetical protein